jgi:hypothetical protein
MCIHLVHLATAVHWRKVERRVACHDSQMPGLRANRRIVLAADGGRATSLAHHRDTRKTAITTKRHQRLHRMAGGRADPILQPAPSQSRKVGDALTHSNSTQPLRKVAACCLRH